MHIDDLQAICRTLPAVTEDVKWEHDLCFCVGGKMFLVVGLDQLPVNASFKVPDEEYEALSTREGFAPAPYLARYKWVSISDIKKLSKKDWEHYVQQSYQMIKEKLPKKVKKEMGLD